MSPDDHVAVLLKQAPQINREQALRLVSLLDVPRRKVAPRREAA